jgi:hypothetical protein
VQALPAAERNKTSEQRKKEFEEWQEKYHAVEKIALSIDNPMKFALEPQVDMIPGVNLPRKCSALGDLDE